MKQILIFVVFLLSSISYLSGQQKTPRDQYYFQQNVSYDIQVKLDIGKNLLVGFENLIYKNNSSDILHSVWFHLYPNAYKDENSLFSRDMKNRGINDFYYTTNEERGYIKIQSIKDDGKTVQWIYKPDDETEMQVFLNEPIAPGDSAEFNIQFMVKIPIFISRMGRKGYRYELSQWYPKIAVYDLKGWHNDGYRFLGEFYGDYGTFKVSMTVPEPMCVAATGKLITSSEISLRNSMVKFTQSLDSLPENVLKCRLDSIKTEHKKIEKQLKASNFKYKTISFIAENVHDFAWVCDFRYLIRQSHFEQTDINLFVLPEHYIGWQKADQYALDALKYMTSWYGSYIYSQLSVIDSECPFGGMEYPNLILVKSEGGSFLRRFEEVIMHEIGHQWFYGMLGNNEMDEAWLDEGLVMFSEMRYFKEKYDEKFSDSKLLKFFGAEILRNHRQIMKMSQYVISAYDYIPNCSEKSYVYRSRAEMNNVYIRPAFTMGMLQYMLGDSLFNTAMQIYYKRYRLKHVTGSSLIKVFNETTNQNLDWFFKEWIYSKKECDFKAGSLKSIEEENDTFNTTFEVIKSGGIKMPVVVEFQTRHGEKIRKNIFADKNKNFITLKTKDKIISANIDPDRNILEFNQRNNATGFPPVSMRFLLSIPSFEKYSLLFSPLANHSSYSGWGAGIGFALFDFPASFSYIKGHEFVVSALYYPKIKNTDFYIGYTGTTNLFKRYNRFSTTFFKLRGKKQIDLGFEYRFGRYRFENPSQNLFAQIRYSEIFEDRYCKKYQASEGRDFNIRFHYTLGIDHGLFSGIYSFGFEKGTRLFSADYDYTKMTLETTQDFPISYRFTLTHTLNFGAVSGDYPPQESLFLSPIDALGFADLGVAFGFRYKYDRRFTGKLTGYTGENLTGKYLLSSRLDMNIHMFRFKKEPFYIKIFGETGKLWNSNNLFQRDRMIFMDGGMGLRFFGLHLFLPLWKNYEIIKIGDECQLRHKNNLGLNGFFIELDFGYLFRVGLDDK